MPRPVSSAVHRRRRRHIPLLVEPIEPRHLLAATLNGNVLQITGTSVADAYTVKLSGTNLVVQRAGEAAQSFAKSAVAKITANLGGGNDSILIDDAVNTPASLRGEAGDDTLRGGVGKDTVDGGSGYDTVTYAGRTAGVTASLGAKGFYSDGYDRSTVGYGSGGTGTEADGYAYIEKIAGGNGNDTFSLFAGNVVDSPATPFVLRGEGGAGNDTFTIASHAPTGGTAIYDSNAIDIIADGGLGNDAFDVSENRDPPISVTTYGGDGDDTYTDNTDDGSARFVPGAGNDTVVFGERSYYETATYSLGTDLENLTVAGAPNVVVYGNDANNRITVRSGNATIYGGGGNDTLIGSSDDDSLDGGAGTDTVDYSARTAAVTGQLTVDSAYDNSSPYGGRIAISAGTAGASGESDALKDVETIVGGSGNDTLSVGVRTEGGSGAFKVVGGPGNDHLSVGSHWSSSDPFMLADGGPGNDVLDYDGYFNALAGGDGDDVFNSGTDDSYASIDAGAGRDTHSFFYSGGPSIGYTIPLGLEVLYVGTGSVSVTGNDEANEIHVYAARVSVDSRGGNDRVWIEGAYGSGPQFSSLDGGAGNDSIVGGTGSDTIDGGTSDDTLVGGAGNDSLRGGDGNDRIDPGAGNDTVDGGTGGGNAVVYSARNVPVTGTLSATLRAVSGGYVVDRSFVATLTENGVAETDTGVNVEVLTGGNAADNLTAVANAGAWQSAGTTMFRPTLIVNGGWGNDTVNVRGALNADGSVANTVTMIAFGSDGNDTLNARATTAARATLDGGNGDDWLGYGGNVGTFAGVGGAGRDTLRIFDRSYLAAAATFTLPGDVEDATVEAGARVDVVGNALNNRITVNAPGTSIKGLGGNDTITGSNSADTLDGGDGDDSIVGNGGNDFVYGYAGNDRLFGGSGLDKLYGGIGNDFLDGGLGSDSLYGEAGTDTAVRDPADAIVDSVEAYA